MCYSLPGRLPRCQGRDGSGQRGGGGGGRALTGALRPWPRRYKPPPPGQWEAGRREPAPLASRRPPPRQHDVALHVPATGAAVRALSSGSGSAGGCRGSGGSRGCAILCQRVCSPLRPEPGGGRRREPRSPLCRPCLSDAPGAPGAGAVGNGGGGRTRWQRRQHTLLARLCSPHLFAGRLRVYHTASAVGGGGAAAACRAPASQCGAAADAPRSAGWRAAAARSGGWQQLGLWRDWQPGCEGACRRLVSLAHSRVAAVVAAGQDPMRPQGEASAPGSPH